MTEPAALPRLLAVAEAAELLRTTRAAIYARISRGQMPGVLHDGRRVLISAQELLESLRVAPPTPGAARTLTSLAALVRSPLERRVPSAHSKELGR